MRLGSDRYFDPDAPSDFPAKDSEQIGNERFSHHLWCVSELIRPLILVEVEIAWKSQFCRFPRDYLRTTELGATLYR
jgi:hypothetical protein